MFFSFVLSHSADVYFRKLVTTHWIIWFSFNGVAGFTRTRIHFMMAIQSASHANTSTRTGFSILETSQSTITWNILLVLLAHNQRINSPFPRLERDERIFFILFVFGPFIPDEFRLQASIFGEGVLWISSPSPQFQIHAPQIIWTQYKNTMEISSKLFIIISDSR